MGKENFLGGSGGFENQDPDDPRSAEALTSSIFKYNSLMQEIEQKLFGIEKLAELEEKTRLEEEAISNLSDEEMDLLEMQDMLKAAKGEFVEDKTRAYLTTYRMAIDDKIESEIGEVNGFVFNGVGIFEKGSLGLYFYKGPTKSLSEHVREQLPYPQVFESIFFSAKVGDTKIKAWKSTRTFNPTTLEEGKEETEEGIHDIPFSLALATINGVNEFLEELAKKTAEEIKEILGNPEPPFYAT